MPGGMKLNCSKGCWIDTGVGFRCVGIGCDVSVPRSVTSLYRRKMNHQSLLFRTGARQAQLALQAVSMKFHHALFVACALKREYLNSVLWRLASAGMMSNPWSALPLVDISYASDVSW